VSPRRLRFMPAASALFVSAGHYRGPNIGRVSSAEPAPSQATAERPNLPTAPYRGTRDFLPDEMSVRDQVFGLLHRCLEGFGYQRYDGPLLEPAEIYEAKSGAEIASQELYSLTDRGGRRLALRPEMTPSVARMIAGHAGELAFPVRWYCNVNCHRYQRPQRGRTREHWQINVDNFGSASPNCEIEIFDVIHAMFSSVGASRDMYSVRVSDRMLLDSLLTDVIGISRAQVRPVSSILDRWAKSTRDDLLAAARGAGLTDRQFGQLEAALQDGEGMLSWIPASAVQRSGLAAILASGARDLVIFDPMIVRGFDYYTSTVFEVFDTHPANARSLFGGGRYDDLTSLFSDRRIPGIGFGMGDVTLMDFLDVHGLLPAARAGSDVVVLPVDAALHGMARAVAAQIRMTGCRAVVPVEPRRLGTELGRAAQSGVAVVVIIGSDESERGELIVRNLRTREQLTVAMDQAAATVAHLLTGMSATAGTRPRPTPS
jgi:histidyl-tRNA synthetase